MATVLHSESRKLYSWWWDSHISPKNSKWLQENLADMDDKIKAMIRLIEEDADSFARRAEMYYKKRPELMKLVEEFYRAYRALAERYDHATGELRQAHRTIAAAFPCQVPYVLADDPVSVSSGHEGEPRTPGMPYPICSFLDPEDLQKDAMELSSTNLDAVKSNGGNLEGSDSGISKKGLKQLHYIFGPAAASHISETGEINMNKDSKLCETVEVNADKEAETEAQPLKKALKEVQADMEAVFLQHKQNLEKLSGLEKDLKDAEGLDERTSSEMEIKILEEALAKVEAERDAGLIQYNKNLEAISALENTISLLQEDAKGSNARAVDAEVEVQNLKQEISRLESEKEAGLLQYNQCLELISIFESKISLAEENARLLNELTKKAETEVKELKEALTKLNEEKYAAELRYEQCLERIAVMEVEKSHAEKDVKRLNSEILTGAAKLQSLEERCFLLERANESLKLEAENLVQKIALKDHELSEKESELEKLQTSLQDERSQFVQVEATLLTLQKLLSQSQDDQRAFAVQLQQKLQLLNDLEASNFDLQAELRQFEEKNQGLNELNSTFSMSVTNLRDENFNLKEINEKLEEEVSLQVAQTISLQQEIYHLKEEIEGLHRRYQALLAQVQSVGLDPDLLSSSVKDLQDENMKLKEVCKRDWDEKEILYEKLSKMTMFSEKNTALERSLIELNEKLEGSKEQVKELQDSCQLFQAEKSGIAAEKEIILSQLQIMTENVQKILEKNVLLENSLSSANVELEVCRTKSKGLEEFCEMLKNEKHNLLNERGILVSQLENVEHRLGNLERSFTRLEEKYTDLEKEKESTDGQVKEIWCHLAVEKQERSCNIQSSDSRLAKLENQIHQLQDEWSKKHFEEDFAKAVNAQVEITILQKFIKDLEEKNLSVLIECQKHVEASKLSDKLIAELETENLEQQMELEFLLDEIEKLRIGIHQVYRSLQFVEHVDEIEKEQGSLIRIVNNIEDLKSSLLTSEDEKQQLMVENSVLLTLLEQLRSGSVELESEKNLLEQHFQVKTLQHDLLKKDSLELLEMNRELRSEVTKGQQREKLLEGQLETKHEDLVILRGSYLELQEENRCLCQNFSILKEEMHLLEVESSSILPEVVALTNLSLVFENFGIEIAEELREVHENLRSLQVINKDLKKKVDILGTNLEMKEKMNIVLKETKEKLQIELNEEKDLIDQLNCQIFLGRDFLREKETELLEAKEKLKASNGLNAEHCRTIAALRRKCKDSEAMREETENQILELSKESTKQEKEIECLHQTNTYLESQLSTLHLEVEEQRTREENLSLELLERSNESELWEAEASSFYFDLQISSIREALLENKVHELTAVCERLGEQNVAKDIEVQQMKERFSSLESEIGGLKAHLSAYVPVIACLRQNIESLEHDTLLSAESLARSGGHTAVESVIHPHKMSHQGSRNDESTMITDGISELLKLQSRIKAVQKAVVENMDRLAAEKVVVDKMVRLETQNILNTKDQLKYPKRGAELPELRLKSDRKNGIQVKELVLEKESSDKARTEKNTHEVSEVRNRMLMKDIQLDLVSDRSLSRRSRRQSSGGADQMLELWESAEKSSRNDPIAHTQKQATPMLETVSAYHPSRLKQRSKNSSSNLQIEKEVGVDKMEVSASMIREPNPEGNKGNILERVASDNKRLMLLQTTVRDLKETMERKKNSHGANDLEFQRLKRQLEVAEEAVLELVNASDRLAKDIEKYPSYLEENASMGLEEFSSIGRKRVTEKACKRSEKIARLHFDVQSIQYLLLKQEDDKKNKVRHRFSRSRTGVILRDFISSSKISKVRRRKSSFCGCVRPSNNEYRMNHLTEVLRQD